MPKKTKEQKMAAALRRMKMKVEQSARASTNPTSEKESTAPEYNLGQVKIKPSTAVVSTNQKENRYDYSYITSDLKKVLLFSTAAIALEVALSLTMRLQFAKLLLRRFGIEI